MNEIPDEVLLHILGFLERRYLLPAEGVCTRWRDIIQKEGHLWLRYGSCSNRDPREFGLMKRQEFVNYILDKREVLLRNREKISYTIKEKQWLIALLVIGLLGAVLMLAGRCDWSEVVCNVPSFLGFFFLLLACMLLQNYFILYPGRKWKRTSSSYKVSMLWSAIMGVGVYVVTFIQLTELIDFSSVMTWGMIEINCFVLLVVTFAKNVEYEHVFLATDKYSLFRGIIIYVASMIALVSIQVALAIMHDRGILSLDDEADFTIFLAPMLFFCVFAPMFTMIYLRYIWKSVQYKVELIGLIFWLLCNWGFATLAAVSTYTEYNYTHEGTCLLMLLNFAVNLVCQSVVLAKLTHQRDVNYSKINIHLLD